MAEKKKKKDETIEKVETVESVETGQNTAEQELAEIQDKYLRLLAEYDNFKKRTQKERESVYTDAVCYCISELLPLYDNILRANDTEQSNEKAIRDGIALLIKQGEGIFEKLGVSEVLSEGEFNPELHNAVMHMEDENLAPSTITKVLMKGYECRGKIIRHAMVEVAN